MRISRGWLTTNDIPSAARHRLFTDPSKARLARGNEIVHIRNSDKLSRSLKMAHISTAVEYGLHCLLYLSDPGAGVREASVKDLEELQGVPLDYVAKLFTKLSRAGIVIATEGVRGGFRLGRPTA
jgi:hypothetical protein